MSVPLRFALLGFSTSEQTSIETLFQQSGAANRRMERVGSPEKADLVVVNADDRWTARNLRQRLPGAPVLLIGSDDAGTGWPVHPRPLTAPALWAEAIGLLASRPRAAPASPPPEFAATQPFAPLQAAVPLVSVSGFEDTRPFASPAVGSGSAAVQRASAPARPAYDAIDAHSVLLWRDDQGGSAPPFEPPPAVVTDAFGTKSSGPAPGGLPAMAGFEPTRFADSLPPGHVPAKGWAPAPAPTAAPREREEAQRRQPPPPPEPVEPASSLFVDPGDPPTSSPGLAALGRLPAVLLVGGSRLADSSLLRALRALGCPVDHVQDRTSALEHLAGQAYGFAFLDDRSLGAQTRPLCRALRRRARALGLALNIVVLARDDGLVRRLLARWAGCDTWMPLPLKRKQLSQYLLDARRPSLGP